MLEKERQNHYTNTDKSGEQNVGKKIGKSTKCYTANQCDSVFLFPTIYEVTHTD